MIASQRYFAYGSNMYLPRMQERVPSARMVAVGRVAGHQLTFHKRGFRDGSGKCDACYTGNPGDEVWGVVYAMAAADKLLLDAAEGVGHGYREVAVSVVCEQDILEAFMYVAEPTAINATLRPFDWYKCYVAEAARQHRFPTAYQQRIAAMEAIPDPDPARAAQERASIWKLS